MLTETLRLLGVRLREQRDTAVAEIALICPHQSLGSGGLVLALFGL